ncbi:uncharacterized protein LOC120333345 [Styela clava]
MSISQLMIIYTFCFSAFLLTYSASNSTPKPDISELKNSTKCARSLKLNSTDNRNSSTCSEKPTDRGWIVAAVFGGIVVLFIIAIIYQVICNKELSDSGGGGTRGGGGGLSFGGGGFSPGRGGGGGCG